MGWTEERRKQRSTLKDMEPRKIPVKAFKSSQMTQIWPQIQKIQCHHYTSDSNLTALNNYSRVPPPAPPEPEPAPGKKGQDGSWWCHGWFWVEFVPELSLQWRTCFHEALNDLLKWGEAARAQPGELWWTLERTEDKHSSIIHDTTRPQSGNMVSNEQKIKEEKKEISSGRVDKRFVHLFVSPFLVCALYV